MIGRLLQSLTGRMIVLLVAVVGLTQTVSVMVFVDGESAEQLSRRRDEFLRLSDQLVRRAHDRPFDIAKATANDYRGASFRFDVVAETPPREHPVTRQEQDLIGQFAARLQGTGAAGPDIELFPFPVSPWMQIANGLGFGQGEIWTPVEPLDAADVRGPPPGRRPAFAASPAVLHLDAPGGGRPGGPGGPGGPNIRGPRGMMVPAGADRWPPVNLRMHVPLTAGGWIVGEYLYPPEGDRPWLVALVGQMALSAAAIVIVSVILLRWNFSSMKRLAAAARQIGRGERIESLPLHGPLEVQQVTQSFNDMNQRLGRLIEGRMRMLAAVSHDLRTPITSLKIRAEMIADDDTRRRMTATLDDMQALTETILAAARDDAALEDTKPVDLAALVQSVSDDFADLGRPVRVAPADRLLYACRPEGLKRALRNLIDNALKYGAKADVAVAVVGDAIEITIDDAGPGLPEDQMKKLFQPFVRLEGSRSRETGGYGLGLSIAQSIVHGHGGDIALTNRPAGGLRATISLPR